MDDRLTGNMQEQAESFAATAKGLDERLSRDVQVRRRALQRGRRVDSSACCAETSFCLQENDARIRQVSTLMTGVCGKLDQKFMEQIAGASSRVTRCHQVDLPRV